jgi:serine/threonine protein kinase
MPSEFSSFASWSFSTRRRNNVLIEEREATLPEEECDYTSLISGIANILQDYRSLDLEFAEETRPSFEQSLGRGSSFIVRNAKLPGDTSAQPPVVYKRCRAGVDRRTRMNSILREVRILSQPEMRSHSNIVKLKGIAWEQDDDSETTWPMLVLERAPFGDLSYFLKKDPLNIDVRTAFCFDIATALCCIHEAGIAHGDVKCENVLIFQDDPSSRYVAKLTDFGYAEVCSGNGTKRLGRGTSPWNSPEWMDLIDQRNILFTDVYSLGLLIWRCLLSGQNPFAEEPFSSLPASNRTREIEARKQNDLLLEDALSSVSHLEGIKENIKETLRCSLRAEPAKRDLQRIRSLLQPDVVELYASACQIW